MIMGDLLQSQIRESCKLALPEGLQELMSDISREVLRSQPDNLYQFITDYLEALLHAREALSIACRICGEVSNCSCQPQLDEELRRIGLSEEDTNKAKDIILDHFDKGQVQESNLLVKLSTRTSVTETQLAEVQKAVQKAFQRYLVKRKDLQVSFATVGDERSEDSQEYSVSDASTQSSVSDFYKPSFSIAALSALEDMQARHLSTEYQQCKPSVSATSLAGSFVKLPLTIPYSVHNSESENILIKSEKSVLSLLKSFIFSESRQYRGTLYDKGIDTIMSVDSNASENTDSEDFDDTIKSILSLDIHDGRPKNSKGSQSTVFNVVQENLDESSSGGS